MAKIKFLLIRKEDREKYPNLLTLAELKKIKLMPKPRVKPRALYIWWTPYGRESRYLYDKHLTCPYKMSKEELKEYEEKKLKRRQDRARKKILEQLKESIIPCQKVVFDVETTGLDCKNDEILQFSAINEKGEILLNTYIKPKHKTSWENAESINGISPEMVKNCKTIDELWEDIQKIFLSATELIAYNGSFDISFLENANIYFRENVYLSDVMLDFTEIYGEWNEYYGNYKWQKLTTCASYYGYEFKAHDSLEDVRATLYCYNKIKESNT